MKPPERDFGPFRVARAYVYSLPWIPPLSSARPSITIASDPEETAILYNVACTYALMGESERALSTLEKAVHNGFSHKEWIENDPDFVSIRPEPRFQALLKSLTKSNSASDTRS